METNNKVREAISTLRTALKEIRDDVLDMVMNHKSEDPDSYAHGLCLSIGGACDMALNSTKEFEVIGNDKVHNAASIMGRESINKQCWECANCKEPTTGWDASKFRCAYLGKDFGIWHYDVPNECPCKGKGWMPEKKEGGDK